MSVSLLVIDHFEFVSWMLAVPFAVESLPMMASDVETVAPFLMLSSACPSWATVSVPKFVHFVFMSWMLTAPLAVDLLPMMVS